MARSVGVRSLPGLAMERRQSMEPEAGQPVCIPADTPGVVLLLPPPRKDTQTGAGGSALRTAVREDAPRARRRPGEDCPAFVGVPVSDHAILMRGLRQRWLSAGFKRTQHTLLLVRIIGTDTSTRARRRVAHALGVALSSLGDVFTFGTDGRALLAPDKSLRQVVRIAEGLREAVAEGGGGVAVAAGIAMMHRDDDPALALCTAERNLRDAAAKPAGGVVSETDVRAFKTQAGARDQSAGAGAGRNSTDSPQPQADT